MSDLSLACRVNTGQSIPRNINAAENEGMLVLRAAAEEAETSAVCSCGSAVFTSIAGEDHGGAQDERLPYEAWRCVSCGAVTEEPEQHNLLSEALDAFDCRRGATPAQLAALVEKAESLALRNAELMATLAAERECSAEFRARVETIMTSLGDMGQRTSDGLGLLRMLRHRSKVQ